jgi:hypothetical protein
VADKPVDEIVNVDAALDALPGSPTSSDVYEATLPFSSDAVAAAAARRALAGGGGGGGGGTPAGDTGQVQFNDADAFAASANFVWDDTGKQLMLVTAENGTARIVGNAPGVQLQIAAADGDASQAGGETHVNSGSSAGQNGGDITVAAGGDSTEGDGGNVSISAGSANDGDGGELGIRGGDSVNGGGGQVTINGGAGATLDDYGHVSISSGSQGIQITNGFGLALSEKVDCSALPIADPAVAGQLWVDAGTLKVSAG